MAEKTGYPTDMLELDLDLEADLGIDTVKQVELFGMARGEFDLPRDDSINLSEFNTLRKIVDYVKAMIDSKETSVSPKEELVEKEEIPEVDETYHFENVKEKVLTIVAEKTGYPADMLELDLDLEADLGIDTVKQVELFAMARSEFDIPRDDSINLSEFPTLRHIIEFVSKKTLEGKGSEVVEKKEEAPDPEKTLSTEELKDRINRWVLQADEREPLPGSKGKPLEGKSFIVFGGLKEEVDILEGILGCKAEPMDPNETSENEHDLSGYDGILNLYSFRLSRGPYPKEWEKENHLAIKALYRIVRSMDKVFKKGGFLLSITRMGGRFGLGKDINPINGAISGFTKAVHREYKDTRAMVLDIPDEFDLNQAVTRLADELSVDHGLPEIGWDGSMGYKPVLRIVEPGKPSFLEIKDGMNILITGGGSGITAEIARGLSNVASLKLHLTGRTKVIEDVERFASMDENGLESEKEAIKEKLKASGEKVTPVKIDREFSTITKSISIHRLLKDIGASGSEGTYHAIDVTDVEGMKELAVTFGPFDMVVHAAGIEQSKLIANKAEEDFARVFDTKVKGAFSVLEATREHPLKLFLSFSSVAGRFGNAGQVDYAAANDLLSKLPGAVRSLHPDCVVKSVGWSAWSDVGMASKGSVKTILEIGGITFIPVDKGVSFAIDELGSGKEREVLYSGSMGPLDRECSMRWEEGIIVPSDEYITELEKEIPIKQVQEVVAEEVEEDS